MLVTKDICSEETDHLYLPIVGLSQFIIEARKLVLGERAVASSDRVSSQLQDEMVDGMCFAVCWSSGLVGHRRAALCSRVPKTILREDCLHLQTYMG